MTTRNATRLGLALLAMVSAARAAADPARPSLWVEGDNTTWALGTYAFHVSATNGDLYLHGRTSTLGWTNNVGNPGTPLVGGIARGGSAYYSYDGVWAIGASGHVYQFDAVWWNGSLTFGQWFDLGAPPCGTAVGTPALSGYGPTISGVVRCANGSLAELHLTNQGGLVWAWRSLGHPAGVTLVGDPVRGVNPWDLTLAAGSDGNLWRVSFGTAPVWTNLGQPFARPVTGGLTLTESNGWAAVITHDVDGLLWMAASNDGVHFPWSTLDGNSYCTIGGSPAATVDGAGDIFLYANCTNDRTKMIARYYRNGFWQWSPIFQYANPTYGGIHSLSPPTAGPRGMTAEDALGGQFTAALDANGNWHLIDQWFAVE